MRQALSASRYSTERGRAWRRGLPVLSDGDVTLRGLRSSDAQSLLAHLHTAAVHQYIDRPPSSVEGFRSFIRWTQAKRRKGTHACWGMVPSSQTKPVGIIQVWPVERDFSVAEWGFVLGESYWGTGLFTSGARLLLDFVFGTLGVFRLEARAVDINARGNAVLQKLGATREGMLRGGFRDGDVVRDHVMWSILAPEWAAIRKNPSLTPQP